MPSTSRFLAVLCVAVALVQLSPRADAAAPAPAVGMRGMVVAAERHAAAAGHAMLRAGGNAIDAAVATAFALGVTEPYHSGIGGGGFLLIRLANGEIVAIDARETAPAAATADMFVRAGVPERRLAQRPARGRDAGPRRGLAEALDRLRHEVARRRARAGDRARAGRLPDRAAPRAHPRRLEADGSRRALPGDGGDPASARGHADRAGLEAGAAGARRDAARAREAGTRSLLPRSHRARRSRPRCSAAAASSPSRISRATRRSVASRCAGATAGSRSCRSRRRRRAASR